MGRSTCSAVGRRAGSRCWSKQLWPSQWPSSRRWRRSENVNGAEVPEVPARSHQAPGLSTSPAGLTRTFNPTAPTPVKPTVDRVVISGAERPAGSNTVTNDEKRKLYAALAAPFSEHCIQRTEGRLTGRGYD